MAERVRVIVHDSRLAGDAPWERVNATCVVSKAHTVKSILNWIKLKSTKYGQIDDLYIMAHGRVNKSTGKGGYGVVLGKEGITLGNVDRWVGLRGDVGHIYLYTCAAADWDIKAVGLGAATGDGMTMCSKLAQYTGALVTASDAIQWYSGTKKGQVIDFGAWEGKVYTFDASGSCVDVSW